MGNTYANFTLKHDDAAAVAAALRAAKRDALVAADPKTKCVVVFDREADEQDPDVIGKLGRSLSKALRCPVLAAADEDDDVFRYWLFVAGKAVDAFDSGFDRVSEQSFRPAAGGHVIIARFDPANPIGARRPAELSIRKPAPRRKDERGGDVRVLTKAVGVPGAAGKAMAVLLNDYDVELDRHHALCKALGLSTWAVGGGFAYASAGQLPKGLRSSALIRVGDTANGA